MRKKRNGRAALATALACATFGAAAERLQVAEGAQGEWVGVWVLDATRPEFRITLRSGGTTLTADGAYIRSGNQIAITRTNSSDGNDCHYVGTINGRAIAGRMFCRSGGPYNWTATIASHP